MESEVEIIKDPPRVIIGSTNIVTNIFDEHGNQLEGLTAKFDGEIKIVDYASYFHFEGKDINKFGEVMELTDKDGNAFEFTIPSIENDVCYNQHVVFKNFQQATIQSNEAFVSTLSNQLKAIIPADNLYKNANNFQGTASFKYHAYDLKNKFHKLALPGGLLGFDADGAVKMLCMTHAFKLEAQSSDRQALNFGSKSFIIQPSIVDKKFALYYYDDNTNSWNFHSAGIESDGETRYKIANSGIYCIAEAKAFHQVKGNLSSYGKSNPNIEVKLEYETYQHSVFTTNKGHWETYLPDNEESRYTYLLNCGDASFDISPANADLQLPPDEISEKFAISSFIGEVRDCDDKLLNNSFVRLRTDMESKLLYLEGGILNLEIPMCKSDHVFVQSYDETISEAGPEIEWKSGIKNVVYSTYACNNYKGEFIVLRNEDGSKNYEICNAIRSGDKTILVAKDQQNGDNYIKLIFESTPGGIGLVDNDKVNIEWEDATYGGKGYSVFCPSSDECGFAQFDVSHFSNTTGGWIRGYFKGKFWTKTYHPLQAGNLMLEGEFQIYRDF